MNSEENVVLVDDMPVYITLMTKILGEQYLIKVALNGRKALSITQSLITLRIIDQYAVQV